MDKNLSKTEEQTTEEEQQQGEEEDPTAERDGTGAAEESTEGRAKPPALSGKHVLDFALRACFVLSRKDRRRKVTRRWAVRDEKGDKKELAFTVKGVNRLPWYRDNETLMALITLSVREDGMREIRPSGYEILKLMGMGDSKENYEFLERSIDRLAGTLIKGTFRDVRENEWRKYLKWDHLIDTADLSYEVDEETGMAEGKGLRVKFGDIIWRGIQSGNLATFDWNEYLALEGGNRVRALYQYINAVRARSWEVDIFQLAESHLGMTEYRYPSEIWREIKPDLEKLEGQGVLLDYGRTKHGKYTRVYFVKPSEGRAASDQRSLKREESTGTAGPVEKRPPDGKDGLWDKVLEGLEGRVSEATFSTWLRDTRLLSLDGRKAVIGVGDGYARDWLDRRLKGVIQEALEELGHEVDLEFETLQDD